MISIAFKLENADLNTINTVAKEIQDGIQIPLLFTGFRQLVIPYYTCSGGGEKSSGQGFAS